MIVSRVLPSAFLTVMVALANGVTSTPLATQLYGEPAGGATQL